jgi:hypothetical protein
MLELASVMLISLSTDDQQREESMALSRDLQEVGF